MQKGIYGLNLTVLVMIRKQQETTCFPLSQSIQFLFQLVLLQLIVFYVTACFVLCVTIC